MYRYFNPGTFHRKYIFSKKIKGLTDDKKFEVSTTHVNIVCMYLFCMQLSLGKLVTCIHGSDRPNKHINMIQQHQAVTLNAIGTLCTGDSRPCFTRIKLSQPVPGYLVCWTQSISRITKWLSVTGYIQMLSLDLKKSCRQQDFQKPSNERGIK
jgi:hypothetical protein